MSEIFDDVAEDVVVAVGVVVVVAVGVVVVVN